MLLDLAALAIALQFSTLNSSVETQSGGGRGRCASLFSNSEDQQISTAEISGILAT